MTGYSGKEIVPTSFEISRECFAVFRCTNGKPHLAPCAMFGVADFGDAGIVWFLATDEVRLSPISVIRESGFWLDYMARHYTQGLMNMADLRNSLHIRWAQLSGFTLGETSFVKDHQFQYIFYKPQSCVNPLR